MREWAVDVLVGWLAGSITLGLLVGFATAVLDVTDETSDQAVFAAVVVGTIAGIVMMRRRRAQLAEEESG